MYKVGLCGNYGESDGDYNGQTVKTRTITKGLSEIFGNDEVARVDTNEWQKHKLLLLIQCFNLARNCENIIILPGPNGIRVFSALFLILNNLFRRRIHYIVIGGWLPELLKKDKKIKHRIKKFDGIYVETNSMVMKMTEMGLNKTRYLSNTKSLNIIKEAELVYVTDQPYKLCTFSRVTKEKGIEDAIEAVIATNESLQRKAFTLDIYGQIEEGYRNRFEAIMEQLPDYIVYKGVVNSSESVETLKNYCALLFPTYYEGEGFAGTILDAYASGIPVIATDWKYNPEIIQNQSDGFLYQYKNNKELKRILELIAGDIMIINGMKLNCLKRAKQYSPEVVLGSFIQYLK